MKRRLKKAEKKLPYLFGDRLMVGRQVLILLIGVRIPVPEQTIFVRATDSR